MLRRSHRCPLILWVLGGIAIGAIARGFFPPFTLDDPFWRQFWSGPPAAGIFALLGAGVAFAAARVGARTARRSAERQEWWDRAEWALNLARSRVGSDRDLGLRTLAVLQSDATATELQMIVAVTESVVGGDDLPDVDIPSPLAQN
ncbi:hypothetical protein FB464_1501 [Subtercola boreus]|nr:hypothetical protein FB464_1501 [Subtercola boreus]